MIICDRRKARDLYESALNSSEMSRDLDIYSKLIDIYSDKTTPLYDEAKANELLASASKKGLKPQKNKKKITRNESSTYVCSDLHGEFPAYQAIISQLKESDKLYILGDVIDKGPDGIKILQDVMKRKSKGQVEFLIGNHELMMIQSLILGEKNDWNRNENKETKDAFNMLSIGEQAKIKDFLLNSYVYKNISVNSQNIHLVHARSVQDSCDDKDMTVKEMIDGGKRDLMHKALWDRPNHECYSKDITKKGSMTIIGHTPKRMIECKDGYIVIDCGAGYFGNASLVNLTKGTVKYFDVEYEREKENNKQQEK